MEGAWPGKGSKVPGNVTRGVRRRDSHRPGPAGNPPPPPYGDLPGSTVAGVLPNVCWQSSSTRWAKGHNGCSKRPRHSSLWPSGQNAARAAWQPANIIRGRNKDVRGQRSTRANSALRPLCQFTFKGIRALRTHPFDAEQKGLGPVAMVHRNLGRHVGVESPTEFSIRVDAGGESNLQACLQNVQQLQEKSHSGAEEYSCPQ